MITAAPGGEMSLYFTEYKGDKIGMITTSGRITEYPVPTAGAEPDGIVAGPDGMVYFTENAADQIGQFNPVTHTIVEFKIPTAGAHPDKIAIGADHDVWWTEHGTDSIGELTLPTSTG